MDVCNDVSNDVGMDVCNDVSVKPVPRLTATVQDFFWGQSNLSRRSLRRPTAPLVTW